MKPVPYIGVSTAAVPPAISAQLGLPEGFGLLVEAVMPDSPAKAAGLQQYDVLKQFNDQQLAEPGQLAALVRAAGKGSEVTLTLLRKGAEQKLTIKVDEKAMPSRSFGNGGWNRSLPQEWREQIERFQRGGQESSRWNGAPEVQERVRRLQERLRGYQESVRKWQDEVRRWSTAREGEMPPPPPMPPLDLPESSVRPQDILRDLRPGGERSPRSDWSDGNSRWDASRARATIRDAEGEVELSVQDGHRTLTARTPSGETVYTGQVDTPEERDAVPEKYRAKLKMLEETPGPRGREGAQPPPPPSDGNPPPRRDGEAGRPPGGPRPGPDVQ